MGGTPNRRTSGLIVGLVCAVVGIAVLLLVPVQISGESLAAITNVQSPAFFPILNAVFLTGCGLVLIFRRSASIRDSGDSGDSGDDGAARHPGTLIATVALIGVYLVLVRYVGMVVSSAIAIAAMSVLFGYRNKAVIAVSTVVVPLLIYLLFEKVLRILLPHGAVF